jgi:hypothetical protein
MTVETFDKIAGSTITISIIFTVSIAITSWNWFPTPGEWGDIAQIPQSLKNYIALLLPPAITLAYLLVRRLYFKKSF